MSNNLPTDNGFTLIELSIVLIIIGLLVSGIISGKSLIEIAEIRSQVAQLEDYKKAYYTFLLKYDEVPGDMDNASSYWSGATDGNGDGMVTAQADQLHIAANIEGLSFFQHLVNAELIPSNLIGSHSLGYAALKLDSSKGMVAGGYIQLLFGFALQLSDEVMNKEYTAALMLFVSNPESSSSAFNNNAVFTVLQSKEIDTKIDDGLANAGVFMSHKAISSVIDCLTGDNGDYLMTSPDNLACGSVFIIAR